MMSAARAPGAAVSPAPRTILVVDDSRLLRTSLADELQRAGYAVVLAATGEEALEVLAKQSVDSVLLDLKLPGISGFEVCQAIRARRDLAGLPVILLTGLHHTAELRRGIEVGADDYLAKPVDPSVVLGRLSHYLDEPTEAAREFAGLLVNEPATIVPVGGAPYDVTLFRLSEAAVLLVSKPDFPATRAFELVAPTLLRTCAGEIFLRLDDVTPRGRQLEIAATFWGLGAKDTDAIRRLVLSKGRH